MIEVRNLRVRYPESTREVVSDWTLRFDPGEVVALFGPNGGGKTTGLKAIAGILRPETIESTVGCEAFAYVHQDPLMFHRRVHANIAYGLSGTGLARSEVAGRVRVAARRCNVEEILSQRATQLSGGQRQRVAIARALVLERPVLLLDEPTANLDRESRDIVAGIVREEAAAGRSVVLASHDRDFSYKVGDRFFTMTDGALRPNAINLVRGATVVGEDGLAAVRAAPRVRLFGRAVGPLAAGEGARAIFRPEDVVLSRTNVTSSALNIAPMRVTRVSSPGEEGVLVELAHREADTVRFSAMISRRSLHRLEIRPGANLFAATKASSIAVYADSRPAPLGAEEEQE